MPPGVGRRTSCLGGSFFGTEYFLCLPFEGTIQGYLSGGLVMASESWQEQLKRAKNELEHTQALEPAPNPGISVGGSSPGHGGSNDKSSGPVAPAAMQQLPATAMPDLGELSSKLVACREELGVERKNVEQLRLALQDYQRDADRLDRALTQRQSEINAKEGSLALREQEIFRRAIELDTRQRAIEESNERHRAQLERLADLERREQAIVSKELETQARVLAIETMHAELSDHLQQVAAQAAEYKTVLDGAKRLKSELKHALTERDEMALALAKKEKSLKGANTKLRNSNADLAEEQARINDLNAEIGNSRKHLRLVQRELNKIRDEHADLQHQLAQLTEIRIGYFETLEWLLRDVAADTLPFPRQVALEGDGPWDTSDLKPLLKQLGYSLTKCGARNAAEILIVGTENWDATTIEHHVNARGEKVLKIFPQDLFVAALLCGRDPFDDDHADVLEHFGTNHPVIIWLRSMQFPWPETTCEDSPAQRWFDEQGRVEETPLVQLGYHVGITKGLGITTRRYYLRKAFSEDLPAVESDEYMEGWGATGTRTRLRRMAWHLAMLIKQRRRNPTQKWAVEDWEADLEWLR